MLDVVQTLRVAHEGRDPVRLARKWKLMQADPFAFFRGTCGLFYQRLPVARLPAMAPLAWLCGDLHLENFGAYKGDNRRVYFDINDFDEAALGPLTWDLVRLLASVHVAGRVWKAPSAQAAGLCAALLAAYCETLQHGRIGWLEREEAPGLIGKRVKALARRSRLQLLDRYSAVTVDPRQRRLKLDPDHALQANARQRDCARALVAAGTQGSGPAGFFDVLDVALRVAGNGALGLERYVVLVEGKGSPDRNYLLDIKEMRPSALEQPLPVVQPPWRSPAHRVVCLQGRLQAVPAAFLRPVLGRDKSYLMRGLQPGDDKVTLAPSRNNFARVLEVAGPLGRLLGWAHLRSAGRQGSDPADDLILFGSARNSWEQPLLATAALCAEQAIDDWKLYGRAYGQGAFGR